MPNSSFQSVLFDLDGTLLDTLDDLADAMNEALAVMGLPGCTVEQCKYFVGDGVRNFALRALPPDRRDEATLQRLLAVYRECYGRNWAVKTRPYAGVPEMLDGLAARGLPLAVLSNKPDDFTRLVVAKLLPRWTFAAVAGERPPAPRKPDPGAALEIANRIGVPPERFLYLGDTATDMRTAVAAGMFPVGALWGFRTAEELLAGGARVLVRQPAEVLKVVDGIAG